MAPNPTLKCGNLAVEALAATRQVRRVLPQKSGLNYVSLARPSAVGPSRVLAAAHVDAAIKPGEAIREEIEEM
jgi:hypothetical protein